ncbi:MAG: amidinotransferase [Fusobacterium sp.]|nr:amidinotransferase [Fusobacterium sp.]
MNTHITNKILMIRPVSFAFNEETAVNNYYQKKDGKSPFEIQNDALFEFDNMVKTLIDNGINVKVLEDTKEPHTPDSIFPNNWFSTHPENNTVVLYPMFAKNRRLERREDIYDFATNPNNINIVDYSNLEKENIFLEGTGSLVLDRKNMKAYCSISERADKQLLDIFCNDFGYKKVAFHSYQTIENNQQEERKAIYHTNVMMAMGEKFVIICLDSIDNIREKEDIVRELEANNKEIIKISEKQVENFLGNAIELKNKNEESITVMSLTAYRVLSEEQKSTLEKYTKIVPVDVSTIEKYGGGSARCMIAELFI